MIVELRETKAPLAVVAVLVGSSSVAFESTLVRLTVLCVGESPSFVTLPGTLSFDSSPLRRFLSSSVEVGLDL